MKRYSFTKSTLVLALFLGLGTFLYRVTSCEIRIDGCYGDFFWDYYLGPIAMLSVSFFIVLASLFCVEKKIVKNFTVFSFSLIYSLSLLAVLGTSKTAGGQVMSMSRLETAALLAPGIITLGLFFWLLYGLYIFLLRKIKKSDYR